MNIATLHILAMLITVVWSTMGIRALTITLEAPFITVKEHRVFTFRELFANCPRERVKRSHLLLPSISQTTQNLEEGIDEASLLLEFSVYLFRN